MPLHPDLFVPTSEDWERLSPAELAARLNGPQGQGPAGTLAVGVDLNGTHVRGSAGARCGRLVTGEATLAYRGRGVMVWTAEVRDGRGRVSSLARCTCHAVPAG